MDVVPIALAFIGALSAFGCWTFFLAQDSSGPTAVSSSPATVEPARGRLSTFPVPSGLRRVDDVHPPARAATRVAVVVIAAAIFVSVLAGGPRPPTGRS